MSNPNGINNHSGTLKERVIADVKVGMSSRRAAWRNGVSTQTVRNWCKAIGQCFRTPPIKRLSDEEKKSRAVDIASGMSCKEWCEKYKVQWGRYYELRNKILSTIPDQG